MEENNVNKKQGSTGLGIIIGIVITSVVLIGGYFVYNEFINKDNNSGKISNQQEKKNNSQSQENEVSTKNFTYDNYKIMLVNQIKNTDNIYAIDVKYNVNDLTSFDLYARYTDETSFKIATVKTNTESIFEYRSLDVENNKLYYIINSRDTNSKIFELNYIDLNNLTDGAKKLEDFNQVFIKDNLWENHIYTSQVFVKNEDVYYTSFNNKTLKKYNLQTKKETTILNGVEWTNYYIDKANGKIFYLNNNKKLYLSDLDGKNSIELKNISNSSTFWTNAIYNGSPLFEVLLTASQDDYSDVDLYIYDYNSNSFKKIKENIKSNYKVKYNAIEVNVSSEDDNIRVGSFFVNNR